MLALVLCAAMSATPPVTVAELERLAPPARWVREPLPGLDAELVVLPTKLPNRFVVSHGRVAEATLEAAAPLFAPLDATRAERVVAALARAELVPPAALERLRSAGFSVSVATDTTVRSPFVFERLELRSPQSEPSVVAVRLGLDERGAVHRWEHLVAQLFAPSERDAPLPSAPPPSARGGRVDRSEEIARFVTAARGR